MTWLLNIHILWNIPKVPDMDEDEDEDEDGEEDDALEDIDEEDEDDDEEEDEEDGEVTEILLLILRIWIRILRNPCNSISHVELRQVYQIIKGIVWTFTVAHFWPL